MSDFGELFRDELPTDPWKAFGQLSSHFEYASTDPDLGEQERAEAQRGLELLLQIDFGDQFEEMKNLLRFGEGIILGRLMERNLHRFAESDVRKSRERKAKAVEMRKEAAEKNRKHPGESVVLNILKKHRKATAGNLEPKERAAAVAELCDLHSVKPQTARTWIRKIENANLL